MPAARPSRWWTLLLALAGGLAARVAFPGPGLWPGAFVGIALLYLALRRDSARWNALVGLVWGLAFYPALLTWADEAVGPVPWLMLSLACAAYVALFGAAWTWARRGEAVWRSPWWQVPVFVVIWVALEEALSFWPFGGFPWGRLAFSQSESPLLGFAALGGVPLLSAVVCAVGVLLGRALVELRHARLLTASGSGLAAVALVLAGFAVPLPTGAQSGTLKVGAVQGNVPGHGLDAFGRRAVVLDNHVRGTHALLDHVEPGELDLVLWPENGTDIDPQVDDQAAAAIDEAAETVGAPMLVGTVEYPDEGGRYNTSVLWQPGQGVVASYSKRHPAPFAEYIPLRSVARVFSSAVDRVTRDMLPGEGDGLVPLESERLGRTVGIADVICFEVAYDELVRSAVRAGGEILVVQTNNATFGMSDESTQQLAMSRIRAVEHGRATVQISTVGVSGVIQPNGALTQSTELFTADQIIASLPLRTSQTWATRLGAWPAWGIDALAVCAVVFGAVGAVRLRGTNRGEPA